MDGPLTDSFGAMLVGGLITMMMYGITNLQTYFYYYAYPKDPLRLKLLVTALWVLDTLHVILMGHALYYYLIKSYGKPSQLEEGTSFLWHSSYNGSSLCGYFNAFFVFAHFCFGIEMVILSFVKKRFDRLSELNFVAVPHSLYYFAFDFVIGKLYVNSLLAALNSRKSLHGSAIDTSDFSTAADGSIGFRVATALSTENQNHINLRVRGSGDPEHRGSPYLDEEAAESNLRFTESAKLQPQSMALALSLPRLLFVTCFVVNCILWSQSRYGQFHDLHSSELLDSSTISLVRRGHNGLEGLLGHKAECHPLTFPVHEQCKHARKSCPTSDTFLSLDYLSFYFCLSPALRPLGFVGLILWLAFLFSALGISASDFFIPNLSTIAQLLGLDENVAGVTFLAFGNGSPDVFSTFAAMRTNSGSLAIGELIGAASFIVSVVVGSMCIIKPFQVNRGPFLRDVGFFAAAVALLLVILLDNELLFVEAAGLVVLYVFYALVVVSSSWWERRQEGKRVLEARIRAEYDENTPLFVPYRDNPNGPQTTLVVPTPVPASRARAISTPEPPRIQTTLPPRPHSRSPSPSQYHHHPRLPSFSLVGALEFRQVVNSLSADAAGPQLNAFDSPVTPFAGGHYHTPSHTRSRSPSFIEENPFEASLGVPLDERSAPRLAITPASDSDESRPGNADRDSLYGSSIPSISVTPTPTSPILSQFSEDSTLPMTSRRRRWMHVVRRILHTLFPSLYHFGDKTVAGKLASLFAAPAVMMLTLTLPVVVMKYEHAHNSPRHIPEGRLVDFEEEGVERVLVAEEEAKDEIHDMDYNKWLTAVQCVAGPLFAVSVLFSASSHLKWILLATSLAGAAIAVLVVVFGGKGNHTSTRTARCFMGFFVAIVWIMAVADETVNILRTFGFIFGLSDAIIGLTIFAVGNSLADLVANMSVATFAPIMGFSACFGGPMLNILLGVGISGSYITHQTGIPYELHFSTTLLVSTVGLLSLLAATVIFVPWNGYFLTRSWGVFLIVSYCIIMTTNIVVELNSHH
ncbi:hypothetical protein EYR40_007970 [Pleurotus pulmonarius]|nr:hypothetical protein EYR36_008836 [Pleurotus pulmonarius]KAF4597510.1 hypothetical protein EYR40_007970 [Pleurotus pulmonarius]